MPCQCLCFSLHLFFFFCLLCQTKLTRINGRDQLEISFSMVHGLNSPLLFYRFVQWLYSSHFFFTCLPISSSCSSSSAEGSRIAMVRSSKEKKGLKFFFFFQSFFKQPAQTPFHPFFRDRPTRQR